MLESFSTFPDSVKMATNILKFAARFQILGSTIIMLTLLQQTFKEGDWKGKGCGQTLEGEEMENLHIQ